MDSLADISGLEPGPPPTGDGVLGGVDDDVVLIAGHAAGEEGVDALVEGAALDVLRLLDEQVELREAAATVEEAGLLTPTRGPNGYRRYVSADIDRLQEILLLRHIGVGIAEMYVADERFTSYYDEVVKGCAAWLRDAVIARAR